MQQARRVVFLAVAVELLLLVASGVLLVFYYRPEAKPAWNDISAARPSTDLSPIVRTVHRSASSLLVLTVMAAAVLLLWGAWDRRRSDIAVALSLLVGGLFASFTGYLLPWDQLALWAVTVGQNMRGYSPVIGGHTRFVLLGGTEVSSSTFLRWFYVHTALVGPVLLVLIVVAVRRERSGGGTDPEELAGVVADEGGAA